MQMLEAPIVSWPAYKIPVNGPRLRCEPVGPCDRWAWTRRQTVRCAIYWWPQTHKYFRASILSLGSTWPLALPCIYWYAKFVLIVIYSTMRCGIACIARPTRTPSKTDRVQVLFTARFGRFSLCRGLLKMCVFSRLMSLLSVYFN